MLVGIPQKLPGLNCPGVGIVQCGCDDTPRNVKVVRPNKSPEGAHCIWQEVTKRRLDRSRTPELLNIVRVQLRFSFNRNAPLPAPTRSGGIPLINTLINELIVGRSVPVGHVHRSARMGSAFRLALAHNRNAIPVAVIGPCGMPLLLGGAPLLRLDERQPILITRTTIARGAPTTNHAHRAFHSLQVTQQLANMPVGAPHGSGDRLLTREAHAGAAIGQERHRHE
jgi:hypothetical protein